ncbi:pilus assembly protein [Roseomonas terrae]|uniref:Pilus assembly protein n=1 Tax=Neoroseomonas terrae TaxID=424799 RepID=A0ABS5EHC0_9PROT|nr:TadE/TadG family type IV pilus assembly protein [Neoroseomonas terrae]MBR0650424.1 pilus assembly protein [Neoroseomonas terrae]
MSVIGPHDPPRDGRPQRWALGRRGAAASEFAIIAIPFFIMIIGIMEASWQLMTGAALDHAALRASRYGITGSNTPPAWQTTGQQNVPTCRTQNIAWLVSQSTNGLLQQSHLVVTTTMWPGVAGAGTGTGSTGAGAGGQIISYTLSYEQPSITGGIATLLFGKDAFTHRAFLMVKNEPFENATC